MVLKCRHRGTRQLVAVKRFRQGEDNEQVHILRAYCSSLAWAPGEGLNLTCSHP